ncbi:DUF1931 family protein [Rhodococcus sp. ACPA1]|uniref:DUF1931 family protein n=1 Tax=Rhodococcus sp. ACPA1 TaxID=2028572 RepID=UPI000BB15743|nr:DUF1931 family protein [Rhodococcus sp. ACPA1]PBC58197.1 hypothetical protein CJ177_10490 [Rhodococcus sp. ACPA1]
MRLSPAGHPGWDGGLSPGGSCGAHREGRDARSVRGQLSGGGRSRRRQGRLSPVGEIVARRICDLLFVAAAVAAALRRNIIDCTDLSITKGLRENGDCSASSVPV